MKQKFGFQSLWNQTKHSTQLGFELSLNEIKAVQIEDKYRNVPKFSDRQVWANSADPDQQSDQGLQCLQFRLHLLDALL